MSPRIDNANFIEAKNQPHNSPIWLYRISIDGVEANDLFLAETDYDVYFYRTDADGADYAQIYQGFSIGHDGLDEVADGEITGPTITVGNVSREIMYYVENNDGLRGQKVTIRQAMFDSLSDKDAYIQDVFYVDSVDWNTMAVSFTLVSRLESLNVQLPGRTYARDYCPWTYKGAGCWESDGAGGYQARSGFQATDTMLCATENKGKEDDSAVFVKVRFPYKNCTGLSRTNGADYIQFDIKASEPTKLTYVGAVHFAAAGSLADADIADFWYATLPAGITDEWQTLTIPADDFSVYGAGPDLSKIDYVAAFDTVTNDCRLYLRNILIHRVTPLGITFKDEDIDVCSKTRVHCEAHNNVEWFGGQPGIPRSKVFHA